MLTLEIKCSISGTIPIEQQEEIRRELQTSLVAPFGHYHDVDEATQITVDCEVGGELKELREIVVQVSDALDNNNVPNGWLHGTSYTIPGKFVTPLIDRLIKHWGFHEYWCDIHPRPWWKHD